MNECPICESSSAKITGIGPADTEHIVKCETCGIFKFPNLIDFGNKGLRYKLQGYIRNQMLLGQHSIHFKNQGMVDKVLKSLPPVQRVNEKINRIIQYMGENSPTIGSKVKIDSELDFPICFGKNRSELDQILSHLLDSKIITDAKNLHYRLTMEGYKNYEDLKYEEKREIQHPKDLKGIKIFHSPTKQYEKIGVIGEGGSGRVFEVQDGEGTKYALKIILPERATKLKLKRFKNELDFCLRDNHTHIIQIFDVGYSNIESKKLPFYIMKKYKTTLRKLMDAKIKFQDIQKYFSQLLDGVEAAHLKIIWHRDLKPENVLFDDTNDLLLLTDFGIAHFEEEFLITSVETRGNDKLFNAVYAAPEQKVKGKKPDHRCDIYALGLILNEMFTGEVPSGEGYIKVANVAPEYEFIDNIVGKMIQFQPERRYQTIEEIKKDLIYFNEQFISKD